MYLLNRINLKFSLTYLMLPIFNQSDTILHQEVSSKTPLSGIASHLAEVSQNLLFNTQLPDIPPIKKATEIGGNILLTLSKLLDKDNEDYLNVKGLLHMQKAQFEEAGECFTKALHRDNLRHDIKFNRGRCWVEVGNTNSAKNDFLEVMEGKYSNDDVFILPDRSRIELSKICHLDGNYDQSILYLSKTLEYTNDKSVFIEASIWQAKNFRMTGELDRALQVLQTAKINDQENPELFLISSEIFDEKGYKYGASINRDSYERLENKFKEDSVFNATIKIAQKLYLKDHYDEAIEVLRELYKQDSYRRNAKLNHILASCYLAKNDVSFANFYIHSAIQADPENIRVGETFDLIQRSIEES